MITRALTLLFALPFPLAGLFAQDCHYIPATSASGDTVVFAPTGSSFESYGCAPIDPTFWMNGVGIEMLITFTTAQDQPVIRLWGMNTDDTAAVEVNGSSYDMNAATAYAFPKVVCGLSPGPDGVIFINGVIVGANTPFDGNFSYSDVELITNDVSTVRVRYRAGAGYGFAGVVLDCPAGVEERTEATNAPFPNPTTDRMFLPVLHGCTGNVIYDATGVVVMRVNGQAREMDLSSLAPGQYVVMRTTAERRLPFRLVVQ